MKKDYTKIYLMTAFAFVAGVILTVFSYQASVVYELKKQAATDHAVLTQVVDFINQSIQQAQQGQQTQVQQKTQPAQVPSASTSTKK